MIDHQWSSVCSPEVLLCLTALISSSSCVCCRVCVVVRVLSYVLSYVCCRAVPCSVVVLSLRPCLRWFVCEFCVIFFRCVCAVVALCCVLFLLCVRVCVRGFLWRFVRVALLPGFSLFFFLFSFF